MIERKKRDLSPYKEGKGVGCGWRKNGEEWRKGEERERKRERCAEETSFGKRREKRTPINQQMIQIEHTFLLFQFEVVNPKSSLHISHLLLLCTIVV